MNEKNYEGLGYLFGSIIGAIATGICVYYTKSVFSGLLCCVCANLGGWIGKSIIKTAKESKKE